MGKRYQHSMVAVIDPKYLKRPETQESCGFRTLSSWLPTKILLEETMFRRLEVDQMVRRQVSVKLLSMNRMLEPLKLVTRAVYIFSEVLIHRKSHWVTFIILNQASIETLSIWHEVSPITRRVLHRPGKDMPPFAVELPKLKQQAVVNHLVRGTLTVQLS